MNEVELAHLKNWLSKANEDMAVLTKLSSSEADIEFYKSGITYHSQQAIEKYLKAYLIYNKNDFRKTHDLEWLLQQCRLIDNTSFDKLDFGNLTDYAISSRYPDDFEAPSVEELKNFIHLAHLTKSLSIN